MHLPTAALSGSNRRDFLSNLARGLLGVSFLPLVGSPASAASRSGPKAKRVIYLYMDGAMSQLDTFDPKPGASTQGETKAIDTNVAGVQLSEHLPELAKLMNEIALVRSMFTETGAHGPGQYLLHTSYREIASTRHPSLGAWVQKLSGKGNPVLPGSVVIGSGYKSAGYLGAQYMPVPISDPRRGLENTKPPKYLSEAQFDHRMQLASSFDRAFERRFPTAEVRGYTKLYEEAVALMRSEELKVFDIGLEPKAVGEAYGGGFGDSCLLARRLAQSGIRFIEVGLGGWDDHRSLFSNLPRRANSLDQGLSALLRDLKQLGMLEETLVVVASEFGRTPNINQNAGRDHFPGAFTCLLAGGGVNGGTVYGATDKEGKSVAKDPVSVGEFNSTIAYALGLPHDEEIYSPDGRPFTIGNGSDPIKTLFA